MSMPKQPSGLFACCVFTASRSSSFVCPLLARNAYRSEARGTVASNAALIAFHLSYYTGMLSARQQKINVPFVFAKNLHSDRRYTDTDNLDLLLKLVLKVLIHFGVLKLVLFCFEVKDVLVFLSKILDEVLNPSAVAEEPLEKREKSQWLGKRETRKEIPLKRRAQHAGISKKKRKRRRVKTP